MAIVAFLLGTLTGALAVLCSQGVRELILNLLQTRVVAPVRAASALGTTALWSLVFVNNSVPAVLSFAYPFIIGKVRWTPPLTHQAKLRLMVSFTLLCGFLVGFFGFGGTLGVAWELGGWSRVLFLLSGARLHGPLEFAFILLCVSEPWRLVLTNDGVCVDLVKGIRKDLKMLVVCLLGLLISAAIEVFAGL